MLKIPSCLAEELNKYQDGSQLVFKLVGQDGRTEVVEYQKWGPVNGEVCVKRSSLAENFKAGDTIELIPVNASKGCGHMKDSACNCHSNNMKNYLPDFDRAIDNLQYSVSDIPDMTSSFCDKKDVNPIYRAILTIISTAIGATIKRVIDFVKWIANIVFVSIRFTLMAILYMIKFGVRIYQLIRDALVCIFPHLSHLFEVIEMLSGMLVRFVKWVGRVIIYTFDIPLRIISRKTMEGLEGMGDTYNKHVVAMMKDLCVEPKGYCYSEVCH